MLAGAIACGITHGQERADATTAGSTPGTRLQIWLPVDATTGPSTPPPLRSSATYRVEPRGCPAGTWRWQERAAAENVEFDIASALIVRLELADASPELQESLARAAENVAAAFRVRTGAELDDASGVTLRFADGASPLEIVQKAWETSFEARVEEAAAAIAEVSSSEAASKIRLTTIIARERIKAECAPIEVCDAGAWRPHRYRAKSNRRTALAPMFFSSSASESSDDTTPGTHSASLAAQLGAWLQLSYVREASVGALMANGGDPCQLMTGVMLLPGAGR